jgi:hypothetical protein
MIFPGEPDQCMQDVQPGLPHFGHLAVDFAHMVQPGLLHFAHLAGMVPAQEEKSRAPRAIGIRRNVFMGFYGIV